jgi:putative transposase
MSNYRRALTPGGTWFFTVNLLQRRGNDLLVRHIEWLRACVAAERVRRPFLVRSWVVLPEHMHWIWTLPSGDADFPTRWRRIKSDFSRRLPLTERISPARLHRGERGIWQRRYWEHQIRDERDFANHLDYIHYNPVKHGWAATPADWPHSSFADYVTRGVYAPNWASPVALEIAGEP